MRNLIRITTLTVVTALMTTANADVLFSDSFESADLSASTASVNDINFRWTDANRTGIITQEDTSGRRVFPTRWDEYFNDGQDWSAKDGSYSLSVEYGAGVNMAEQRLAFDPQQELWISYWVRVPTNFKHNPQSPSNNKFFAIWMDDYSAAGNGSTIAWEFWENGSNGSNIAVHYSTEGYNTMGSHLQTSPFITYPDDQGRWMKVAIHIRAASSTNSNDGLIQFYRRWENEQTYSKIHELTDADIGMPSSIQGFSGAYLMGWSNPSYEETTYWLIDDLVVSNTSLLNEGIKSLALSPSNFISIQRQ